LSPNYVPVTAPIEETSPNIPTVEVLPAVIPPDKDTFETLATAVEAPETDNPTPAVEATATDAPVPTVDAPAMKDSPVPQHQVSFTPSNTYTELLKEHAELLKEERRREEVREEERARRDEEERTRIEEEERAFRQEERRREEDRARRD